MNHQQLLNTLQTRFMNNMHRHEGIQWSEVLEELNKQPEKLDSLAWMEETQGEPDVVVFMESSHELMFVDCSKESPMGRRSVCYDEAAEQERIKKGVYPKGNAVGLAKQHHVTLLREVQYHQLQLIEEFDTKTSSWIHTYEGIRALGGAIFADYRYEHVFVYHNSAGSFYSSRGFRTCCVLK